MSDIYFYSKTDKYFELSNFHYAPFTLDGKSWATVEHHFQAMKSLSPEEQEKIRLLQTPAQAKSYGRKVSLRIDWEEVKDGVMYKALQAKFQQHADLRELLLSTGNFILKENAPRDYYWGCIGENMLGKLMMKVREEL
ncbi:N-glycosidase YbiA [Clostridia bacterium]|nr:N-glycosidase YbiA [Clostridia bacterium]